MRKHLGPHLPFLAGVVLMALLAGLPLFQFKLMSGHDSTAYLPRHVEFYEGLSAGDLFPRWAPDLGAGYGEPTFNFNPPLLYYLVAFFHVLGFTFIASEDLAIFALLVLAGLGMYLLASEFFGRRGGLVAAVAYLFAPYVLSRLYVSHALADFSAFAFLPFTFWGLYRFTHKGHYRYLAIGAISLALLLLSSNSVALMASPALVLLVGWLAWADRSWLVGLKGVWCLLLGLGLSAFFWVPALTETDFVHIARRVERLDFHDHFLYLHQLFYSPWGFGLSVRGPQDGLSFALGPVYLLLAGASLLLIRRIRRASIPAGRLVAYFLVVIVVATFLTTGGALFVWERLSPLQPLQFPWRFLSLIAVSTAFLCGFPFLLLGPERHRLANALMALIIGGLLLFGLPHAKPETFLNVNDADYSPQNIAAKAIPATAREFEPIWVREFPWPPAKERLTLLQGKGRIQTNSLSPTKYAFNVEVAERARMRINSFYFPGWRLFVDGVRRPIEHNNPQGLMEFSLEPGSHQVQVHFGDTPVRVWATRLSLLALALLLVTPWLYRRCRFASNVIVMNPGK